MPAAALATVRVPLPTLAPGKSTKHLGKLMKPSVDERKTQSDGGLDDVLAQMRDERIQLMSLVVQTYRHLNDNLANELEQAAGISPVFFDVLIHVAATPDSRLTMNRLSSQVALTTGGLTRLVDRMVEAGLVVRQNSSSDRRSIQVLLTEAGQDTLKRAIAAHVESIDRHLVAPLNDNDRGSLAITLGKVLGQDPSSDEVLYVR
jgi:DNA-binding MarR family transcriptional regulator